MTGFHLALDELPPPLEISRAPPDFGAVLHIFGNPLQAPGGMPPARRAKD